MTTSAVFLPFLLLVASFAQDSVPSDKVPFVSCRGNDSDTPGCITAPRAIYAPNPEYPNQERKAGHEGTVVLWLVVGPEGVPREIRVARLLSHEFDEAAMNAVKNWKFSPATKDGEPVAVQINVRVNFHLSATSDSGPKTPN
jgi:TonB family protein